ncbi:N-acetylmuramoyl-L-alanine amidase [Secundilactobacillus oryzae JCM 18671]|uniref:N-acetylmuramoyl-L-alanine amidase n=1 Tax=Secundilactobacillus oryzae JCM 18671 TaxID=1291743 RepID=A0A081BHD5_9LACO|nr:N-acetylmuramoyl-L-alanine amidase [Secundilactobacillus oryzae]GAK47453.1 N-acetylmuramoyl-L-alanine amidase [Secundilactobacillus oryzae JCM 18671]
MKLQKQNWRSWAIWGGVLIVFIALVTSLIFQNSLVTPISNVRVHTGPNINYTVTDTLPKGQRIHVMAKRDNWYKIRYKNKSGWVASWLVNRTNHKLKATQLSEATIVLDPGHGGHDSGALSQSNLQEKTYTLQQAQQVKKALQQYGVHVLMTRDDDDSVSLGDRAELATDKHADAFISFHYDSSPVANQATGFTTYFYHSDTSKALAESINSHLTGLPLTNRGVDFGNFLVIRDNLRPAVLLEMGYINTTKDFKQIRSTTYQKQVAQKIVTGLKAYFKSSAK